jgi:oxygen-dependent protoporphyrinogen oxidase
METLVATLASQGGFRLRNNLRVSDIWPVQGGWKARGSDGAKGRSMFARQLVLCTPADAAASLVNLLDPELARLLAAIEYTPVNIVHTGFDRSKIRHPLDGSGFLVPKDSRFGPNGCLWISSLFPGHAPADKVLLSNYLGGARNPAVADWEASRCLDSVMHMLHRLLGISADPDLLHIETHARALPLYHGAYSQRLQAIEQRLRGLPGLYLEANYKGGVSVRDRILCADALARRILQQRARKMQQSNNMQNPEGVSDIAVAPATAG